MIGIWMLPGLLLISLLNLIDMEAQAADLLNWFMGVVYDIARLFNWGG